MPVKGSNHQLGRMFESQQSFVSMQAKIVLERRINAGQHLDVRAGGEKLVASSGEHDDVNAVIHARLQDRVVQLPVHLVGVSVGRRIIHLDDGDSPSDAVVDQRFGRLAGTRLNCGCHIPKTPSLKSYCNNSNVIPRIVLPTKTADPLGSLFPLGCRPAFIDRANSL